MSMCESILTIALVCTVKYLHYCDYYYTLGNDSQSTPKLIAYDYLPLTYVSPHLQILKEQGILSLIRFPASHTFFHIFFGLTS